MRRRVHLIAVTCAVLSLSGLAGTAAPAAMSPVQQILKQCGSGLTGHFTLSELEQAAQALPASDRQYSLCYDVIQGAIAHAKRHTGGAGGGSGGSFLPTPVIVIIVLLILAGITFGAFAVRRRQSGAGDDDEPPGTG
ncbi:MAG: hypothetical protein ACRDNJ_03890 [Solirubrobacteraceae bacterium]